MKDNTTQHNTSYSVLLLMVLAIFQAGSVKAQEYDYETCINLGGEPVQSNPSCSSGNPLDPLGTLYHFPQLVTCNAYHAEIQPASAGKVLDLNCPYSISGCSPSVCVNWNTPGYHQIRVWYQCWGYTETRTRTVYVSRFGINYSQSTLSDISNCPAPNSSFTVNRSTTGSGPVKRHRIQVFRLDGNGQFVSPAHYDSNWQNGDLVSKTINSANGLNFQPDTRYRVRVLTESACGSHTFDTSPVITGAPWQEPVVDFKINGSSNFPVNLFTCNNLPTIMNDATTYPGCRPNLTGVLIRMDKTNDCNNALVGTAQLAFAPYSASYDLRTLFPTYTSTPGFYLVSYYVGGAAGTFGPATHCIAVNGLSPSNAEFKLKAPNNGQPIDRNPNDVNATNVALGGLSAGLYLVNTTSEVGSLDYYRVEIWRIIGFQDVEPILNSGNIAINAQHSFPQGYDFNPPTNGYFFNLSAAQKDAYRFKVRFTVHNECGETYQESYFRILPDCQFCLVADENELSITTPPDALPGTLGRNAAAAIHSVFVYPNPMDEVLRVRFDLQQQGEALFDVYDATGRSVIRYQHSAVATPAMHEESFNVGHLPPGVYFWYFGQNARSETGRLIKN